MFTAGQILKKPASEIEKPAAKPAAPPKAPEPEKPKETPKAEPKAPEKPKKSSMPLLLGVSAALVVALGRGADPAAHEQAEDGKAGFPQTSQPLWK